MRIDDLLNKYFEGETTCNEEKELRRFFSGKEIPGNLLMYRPLFTYINEEIEKQKRKKPIKTYIYRIAGSIAACLMIGFIGNTIYKHVIQPPENYVVIDGKQFTNTDLIKQYAQIAFSDVSFTQEDIFDTLFE